MQENNFYAYGMRKDALSYARTSFRRYRHGYQGLYSSADEETGYDSFELRMYDARVGRWMRTDPIRQFHSPYMAMGINPISGIDPTGGENEYNYDNKTGKTTLISTTGGDKYDFINTGHYEGKAFVDDAHSQLVVDHTIDHSNDHWVGRNMVTNSYSPFVPHSVGAEIGAGANLKTISVSFKIGFVINNKDFGYFISHSGGIGWQSNSIPMGLESGGDIFMGVAKTKETPKDLSPYREYSKSYSAALQPISVGVSESLVTSSYQPDPNGIKVYSIGLGEGVSGRVETPYTLMNVIHVNK